MQVESKSPMRIEGNVIKDVTAWLVDPAAGNLHLRAGAARALGAVKRLAEVPEDIDRQPRAAVHGGRRPPAGKRPLNPAVTRQPNIDPCDNLLRC